MTWLDGQAVIITGAGRGLGRAFAVDAAARGAAVVVNDVDAAQSDDAATEIVARGGHAVAHHGSVSRVETGDELVELALQHFGRCDGLVNNAGQFIWQDSGAEDPARVRALVETNVLGAVYCGAAAVRHFRSAGGGTIVNVSSKAYLGLERMAAYAATKGALVSLTYSWAKEFADTGIRVNCIVPRAATRMSSVRNDTTDFPDPSRIAPVVSMLLSSACTPTSGAVIAFDGRTLARFLPPTSDVIATENLDTTPDELMASLRDAVSAGVSRG